LKINVSANTGATDENDADEPETELDVLDGDGCGDGGAYRTTAKQNNNKNKNSKTAKQDGMTIVQLLNTDKYNRNEKIDFINAIMTPSSEKTVNTENIFPSWRDKVTFIGSTFLNGEQEPYLNHCVVLNTCDEVDNNDSLGGYRAQLLLKWTELIVAEKPNIIIGYNIFGFDYEFMFRRSQETYCEREFLMLSMNADELCANEDKNTGKLSLGNTKVSLASGEYDLWYPVISGFCRLICILILGGTTTYPRINSTTLLVILSATI
jgi:hypothetical protein